MVTVTWHKQEWAWVHGSTVLKRKIVSCLATAALWSTLPINQPPKNACLHRVLRQAKSSYHLYSMRCSLQSSIILLFTRQEVHIIGSKDRIVDDNVLCKKELKVSKRMSPFEIFYANWSALFFSLRASLVCSFFFQSEIHFLSIIFFVCLKGTNVCHMSSVHLSSTREHWRKWGMKSVVPGILQVHFQDHCLRVEFPDPPSPLFWCAYRLCWSCFMVHRTTTTTKKESTFFLYFLAVVELLPPLNNFSISIQHMLTMSMSSRHHAKDHWKL